MKNGAADFEAGILYHRLRTSMARDSRVTQAWSLSKLRSWNSHYLLTLGQRAPITGNRSKRFLWLNSRRLFQIRGQGGEFDRPAEANQTLMDTTSFDNGPSRTAMDIYLELAKLPTYHTAQFQSKNVLRVTSSSADHARDCQRKSDQTYFLGGDDVVTSFAPDTPEIISSAVSQSGRRLAVFREKGSSGSPKRFVEIWANNTLQASAEVTKTHGAFFTDDVFSLVSFSPSEDSVVYTAEEKDDDRKDSESLDKYNFVPPLGEGYPGRKKPGLYYFHFGNGKPSVKNIRPEDSSLESVLLTQPVFVTEDKLVAIGYSYTPDNKLLGIKLCPNRLAGIYDISLGNTYKDTAEESETMKCQMSTWTPPEVSYRSPRIIQRGGSSGPLLACICNPVGGPHAACSELHAIDLSTKNKISSLATVWDPSGEEFPGLYTTSLPTQPFVTLGGEIFVVSTSVWRSRTVVILVSVNSGKVVNLTPDDDSDYFSWSALGTDGEDQIVCSRSSQSSPPELLLGRLSASGVAEWKVLAKPSLSDDLRERLAAFKTLVLPVEERNPAEMIVVRSADHKLPLPCVTIVHGGPHSATSTGFNVTSAVLALEGYVVSLPNYTGSTGFGQNYVQKLLGQIGTLEIQDCVSSVRQLISSGIAKSGTGSQFLIGGSHGGFILGHLLGQYPEIFSAASIRNPVIHLGDITGTDIPDWYYEESGVPYTPKSLITPDLYQKLFQMSPIAHVEKTRDDVPILLCIGEKDARVANSQGKTYYHALKARGKNVRMLTFKDDSHPLDSLEASRVVFKATWELFNSVRK